MEKRVHSVSKIVRLTPMEAEVLDRKAKENDMTASAYLRLMITQNPNDYPEIRALLRELINEINHIGNNINQIVKSHNAGYFNEADKDRLFAYMKKLNTTLDKAVRSIGNQ